MLPELVDFLNLPAVALVALDAMRHFAELALLHVQARRGHSLLLLLLQREATLNRYQLLFLAAVGLMPISVTVLMPLFILAEDAITNFISKVLMG